MRGLEVIYYIGLQGNILLHLWTYELKGQVIGSETHYLQKQDVHRKML